MKEKQSRGENMKGTIFKTVVREDLSEPCDLSRDPNPAGEQAMPIFGGKLYQAEGKAFTQIDHAVESSPCVLRANDITNGKWSSRNDIAETAEPDCGRPSRLG